VTLKDETPNQDSQPAPEEIIVRLSPSEDGSSPPATVKLTLKLPPGTRARVSVACYATSVETKVEQSLTVVPEQPIGIAPARRRSLIAQMEAARQKLSMWAHTWPYSLPVTLFALGLTVYLFTRLIGLTAFPIYFFSDEAIQPVLAEDFIRQGFRNASGEFLPTFFQNIDKWTLGVTVYLQLLPTLLFGKSVFVARGTFALVTLLAAVSLGLTLRDIFKDRFWWSAPLLLAVVPVWFLHSRTAFESPVMVSLYAGALYFYLRYRTGTLHAVYPALILAGLAFYSYSPGQLIVGLTILLLTISDAGYHWQKRKVIWPAIGVGVLLALPYLRFYLAHPTFNVEHLRTLNSYWLEPISLGEKLLRFARAYGYFISPMYWFIPNDHDLIRHLMKGYGHLLLVTLPFAVWGLVVVLRNLRSSTHRAVLISLLVTPVAASLVTAPTSITRCLSFVIPVTLLTALGLSGAISWAEKRFRPSRFWSPGLFAVLALMSFAMMRDALVNGPTWYQKYGLDGMQYGASQVFGEIKGILKEQPDTHFYLSSDWSFSIDVIKRFFLPESASVRSGGVDTFVTLMEPLDDLLFIFTAPEYQRVLESGRFEGIRVQKMLPYPNQQPGFYFMRMRYVENITEIVAAEQAERMKPKVGEISLDGQTVHVLYSNPDMGNIENVFDGKTDTLMRTGGANPMLIELDFPSARRIEGYGLIFGSTTVEVIATLYPSVQDAVPVVFTQLLSGTVESPGGTVNFDFPVDVSKVRFEIRDTSQGEPGHVHVWELTLK